MVTTAPVLLNLRWLQYVTAGDQNLKDQLLQVFLDDTTAQLYLLQNALIKQDWMTLKKRAHGLKGSSGSIGAESIQALCLDLEQASQTQDSVRAKQRIDELRYTLQSFRELVKPQTPHYPAAS